MNFSYIESVSKVVQDSYKALRRKYPSWIIKPQGGGNGNYILIRPSDVVANGRSYRDIILRIYGRTRLDYALFKRFCEDIESGKINPLAL